MTSYSASVFRMEGMLCVGTSSLAASPIGNVLKNCK